MKSTSWPSNAMATLRASAGNVALKDCLVAVARYAAKHKDKARFQVAYDVVLDEYHDRDEKKAKENNEMWSPQRWANRKSFSNPAPCSG